MSARDDLARVFGDRRRRHPRRELTDSDLAELEAAQHRGGTDPLATLNANVSRLTQEVEWLRGLELNHTLFAGVGRIPPAGDTYWSIDVETPFARVMLQGIGADVRLENSPPRSAGVTITEGRGVLWAPAALGKIDWPLTGNVVTVYGPAGTYFNLALLSKPL